MTEEESERKQKKYSEEACLFSAVILRISITLSKKLLTFFEVPMLDILSV